MVTSATAGLDKALMHYQFQHYKSWKEELPVNAHLFTVGGFGENIVSESVSQNDIWIGDILCLKEVLKI
jgi:MOSC domain-containing protein YiiM